MIFEAAGPHPIPLPQAGEGTRPGKRHNRVPSPTKWERVRVRVFAISGSE